MSVFIRFWNVHTEKSEVRGPFEYVQVTYDLLRASADKELAYYFDPDSAWIVGTERYTDYSIYSDGEPGLIELERRPSAVWEGSDIVLYRRRLNDERKREYVTWLEDSQGERCWGHYHEDLGEAYHDFKCRERRGD